MSPSFVKCSPFLIAFLTFQPANPLWSQPDKPKPAILILAVDASQSMQIQDEAGPSSRWDALRRILKDSEPIFKKLQEEQNVKVVIYRFGADVGDFDPKGKADSPGTDFGQLLHSLYETHGQDANLASLLILSDGADNGLRYRPLEEATRWRKVSCPIHTFALGNAATNEKQRDLVLTDINLEPTPVPIKGKLTVRGLIDAPGFENSRVTVRLFLEDKEIVTEKVVLTKTVGNEVRFSAPAPEKPGDIKVTLKLDSSLGETSHANNETSTFVSVVKEGITVLMVDRSRFPEAQTIQDAFGKDPRLRLYATWRKTEELERDQADLFQFDKNPFDVIILGDLSARRLSGGNPKILERIRDLVKDKGAGLLLLGGENTFGNGDWKNTPLEELLPVRLDVAGQREDSITMEPTRNGLNHFLLRLSDKPEESKALWKKLPQLDGMTRLGKPKPGATVLAQRAGTEEPILVAGAFGKGRTLAFAADTTWRWQRLGQPKSDEGVQLHTRFWKQAVFWLAQQDEAEGSLWVKADQRRLPAGSKLGFRVGLRGPGGKEIKSGQYEVRVLGPDGKESTVPTARDQEAERGTFLKTGQPGEYRLMVRGQGKDADGKEIAATATIRFLVYQDDLEMVRQVADHDFLEKLSAAGGGKFYRLKVLPTFLKELGPLKK